MSADLIALTGPNDQTVYLNPAKVVSFRAPRSSEHFAKGTRCVINTTDGHFTAVVEDCPVVRLKLEGR